MKSMTMYRNLKCDRDCCQFKHSPPINTNVACWFLVNLPSEKEELPYSNSVWKQWTNILQWKHSVHVDVHTANSHSLTSSFTDSLALHSFIADHVLIQNILIADR